MPTGYHNTSEESDVNLDRYLSRNRTISLAPTPKPIVDKQESKYRRQRRGSHDEKTSKPRKFLINVDQTCQTILEQEDTDGDFQITIEDSGPKVLKVGTANSQGYLKHDIRGTYMLSNLLQELAIAKELSKKHIIISESRLNENPVSRLSRIIRNYFWKGLTRKIDKEGLHLISADPKNRSKNKEPRIYVPYHHNEAFLYYSKLSELNPDLNLIVERLPELITPEYVKSINIKPGILALKLVKEKDEPLLNYQGVPFIVPGGRFNEMYGWDSYFESLGLIEDGKVMLAKAMADNFVYQIKHYGKILNANRSYYLTRSQPPFLTDMALKIYYELPSQQESSNDDNEETNDKKNWLSEVIRAAIKEYYTIWMMPPRYDEKSGLSTYHPTGIGMPPETEATHFYHLIEPYAEKLNITIEEYMDKYNSGEIKEKELDDYFIHDRAVRESGHDTTYRLEKKCANLATIDLNFLLYKYEMDIANTIRDIFNDRLEMIPETEKHRLNRHTGTLFFQDMKPVETSKIWYERAQNRKQLIEKYMYDEKQKFYFDYNIVDEKRESYESVTVLWGLWAECIPREKAQKVAKLALKKFEFTGGLVCGTERSRGKIGLDRPNRQWDYPYGWAPHQIMAWEGLRKYGMMEEAQRIAYRWLFTITKSFVDFNGVVPEKFDIVSMTHKVKVEYGNVGTDFKYVPREGFGWMNASYQVGLTFLNLNMKRALGALIPPDTFLKHNLPVYSESEDLENSPVLSASQRSRSRSALPQSSQLLKVFMELTNESSQTLPQSNGITTSESHNSENTDAENNSSIEPKYLTVTEDGQVKLLPK